MTEIIVTLKGQADGSRAWTFVDEKGKLVRVPVVGEHEYTIETIMGLDRAVVAAFGPNAGYKQVDPSL